MAWGCVVLFCCLRRVDMGGVSVGGSVIESCVLSCDEGLRESEATQITYCVCSVVSQLLEHVIFGNLVTKPRLSFVTQDWIGVTQKGGVAVY